MGTISREEEEEEVVGMKRDAHSCDEVQLSAMMTMPHDTRMLWDAEEEEREAKHGGCGGRTSASLSSVSCPHCASKNNDKEDWNDLHSPLKKANQRISREPSPAASTKRRQMMVDRTRTTTIAEAEEVVLLLLLLLPDDDDVECSIVRRHEWHTTCVQFATMHKGASRAIISKR